MAVPREKFPRPEETRDAARFGSFSFPEYSEIARAASTSFHTGSAKAAAPTAAKKYWKLKATLDRRKRRSCLKLLRFQSNNAFFQPQVRVLWGR